MEKLTGPLQKDYKNTLIIGNRFDKERMKKNYLRINVVIALHDCIYFLYSVLETFRILNVDVDKCIHIYNPLTL